METILESPNSSLRSIFILQPTGNEQAVAWEDSLPLFPVAKTTYTGALSQQEIQLWLDSHPTLCPASLHLACDGPQGGDAGSHILNVSIQTNHILFWQGIW